MTTMLMIHLAITWIMVGIIWMVQVVHYPLMAYTGPDHSARYQQLHVQRMGVLVGPIMVVEAVAAVWLCVQSPMLANAWAAWLGLGLLAGIWLVTVCISVPAHEALTRSFDPTAHRRLVSSNGIRSAFWSCRGLVAMFLVVQ